MSTTISGTTGIDKVQDGTTINASSIMGALNATGTAPIYACRAWVNFNGTGTVAIRGSGNVSSITDNGTGNYTVNLTIAMPDDKSSVVCTQNGLNGDDGAALAALTDTSFTIITRAGNSGFDRSLVTASLFR